MNSPVADWSGAGAAQRHFAPVTESRHLADGMRIVVRPICPEDDAMERVFIRSLSGDSRYNRLLGARKLTPDEVRQLTCIDYDREMAFVAVTAGIGPQQLLGVARYVRDADGGAEFAIVVADAWQRKGIGSMLLDRLQRHARSAGIARLHGITLATNDAMQNLARKLGFRQQPYPQDATLRLAEKMLGVGIPGEGGVSPHPQPVASFPWRNPSA